MPFWRIDLPGNTKSGEGGLKTQRQLRETPHAAAAEKTFSREGGGALKPAGRTATATRIGHLENFYPDPNPNRNVKSEAPHSACDAKRALEGPSFDGPFERLVR